MYAALILEQPARVLSLMDREALSPTAGCCDRTYWAWKFVDFPGARFQEALCVLSFLYSTRLEQSPYYQSARLLEWIGNGLRFWSAIQNRDGSFDEAYPFERSLAATAFTTFYVGEALELLGDDLPPDLRASVRETMSGAARWLVRNDETHGFLSNHLAAAAAALYHVYRVTGEEAFERRSRYFIAKIMDRQSSEGWYEEYGGADPGYQTHGSFYLARYWQLSGDERLAQSLGQSMAFIAHFVHPDGSLGGEYASRNTQTYYPAAFEMMATRHSAAAWIAETMRHSILNGAAAGLRCIDAYNYFPCLNNLVFAHLACAEREGRKAIKPEGPSAQPGIAWFPKAGIVRIRRKYYDAFVGTAKGGVVKVFDRSTCKLVYSDCGYIGRLRDGRLLSSQYLDHGRAVIVEAERVEVDGSFFEISRPTMSPNRFVAFRLFTLSLGRMAGVGRWLKARLVKTLIYRTRALKIRLRRTILFDEASVSICDHLSGPDGGRVESMQWSEVFTTVHMGSSRYFINNELTEGTVQQQEISSHIDPKELQSGITLRRAVTFSREKA